MSAHRMQPSSTCFLSLVIALSLWAPGLTHAEEGTATTFEPGLLMQSRTQYSTSSEEFGLVMERVRPKLRGTIANDAMRYRFSVELAEEKVEVKDVYFDVRLLGDAMIVRVGHFKRPFSRQRLTGVSRQGLADRPITDAAFDADRDLGFQLHNGRGAGLEWALAVTGASELDSPDEPVVPTVTARVGYATKGLKGYSSTDRNRGPFRFGVATSAVAFLKEVDDKPQGLRWELDAIAKVNGLTMSTAVFGKTGRLDATAHDMWGVMGHVGWRFLDWLEVIARTATLFAPSDTQSQVTGGVTGYWFEDRLTVRLDSMWDHPSDDVLIRLQVQFKL